MADVLGEERDLASLVVAAAGSVVAVDDVWEPVRLLDSSGRVVAPVRAFLQDLQAAGRSTATQRSYAMDLLRWFRFCWAIDVPWNQATRVEARDFCRWLSFREKASRATNSGAKVVRGQPNAVTGRAGPGDRYAVSTRAHSETVLRGFYECHKDAGTGPIVNPFPLARERSAGRVNAHHNPMEPFRNERVGWYRPRSPQRIPRCIPDGLFNKLFAELGSHRDRALVALWVRPARGPRSCSGSEDVTLIRASSWS
jgi:hypothetical protein